MNYTDIYKPARILAAEYGITHTELRRLVIGRRVDGWRGGSDYWVSPSSLREWLSASDDARTG